MTVIAKLVINNLLNTTKKIQRKQTHINYLSLLSNCRQHLTMTFNKRMNSVQLKKQGIGISTYPIDDAFRTE